jgi:hypothetical protein
MRGNFSDLIDFPVLYLQDQKAQGISKKDEIGFRPGTTYGWFIPSSKFLIRASVLVEETKCTHPGESNTIAKVLGVEEGDCELVFLVPNFTPPVF